MEWLFFYQQIELALLFEAAGGGAGFFSETAE